MLSVNVILTTNRQGEHHEASEIVYREWRLLLNNTWSDRCLKPLARAEKLTVEMALSEDGADERRNGSQY
jgi:hypothetical protein